MWYQGAEHVEEVGAGHHQQSHDRGHHDHHSDCHDDHSNDKKVKNSQNKILQGMYNFFHYKWLKFKMSNSLNCCVNYFYFCQCIFSGIIWNSKMVIKWSSLTLWLPSAGVRIQIFCNIVLWAGDPDRTLHAKTGCQPAARIERYMQIDTVSRRAGYTHIRPACLKIKNKILFVMISMVVL